MTEHAICPRCGADKPGYATICPACGHRPEDEGLLIAWLLSSEHLGSDDLDRAARRIRRGESIRASDKMIDRARKALGSHLSTDPGLTRPQRLALLATSLLLTPLVGWTVWAWWRQDRPRAAIQALGLSAPASALFFSLVVYLWLIA